MKTVYRARRKEGGCGRVSVFACVRVSVPPVVFRQIRVPHSPRMGGEHGI